MSETPQPPSPSQPVPPSPPQAGSDSSVLLTRQGDTFGGRLLMEKQLIGIGSLLLLISSFLPWFHGSSLGYRSGVPVVVSLLGFVCGCNLIVFLISLQFGSSAVKIISNNENQLLCSTQR